MNVIKHSLFVIGCLAAGFATSAASVRVTDTVNPDARPARIPQGAEELEVERPRAHGGATVHAADFGFSATNSLNASAVMRALDFCRRTKAARLVLAPGTYSCFDPDHGLVVADMEDFTLDGAGATLVFRRPPRRLPANSVRVPHDSSVLVTNCHRCVVGNLSIDWDWKTDPLCDVGVVAATHVDEAENGSYFDLDLPDWPQGHPWHGRPMPIQTMTPINAERTRLTGESPNRLLFGITEGHFGAKMAWLSPRSVRVWPGVREPGQFAAPATGELRPRAARLERAGDELPQVRGGQFLHRLGLEDRSALRRRRGHGGARGRSGGRVVLRPRFSRLAAGAPVVRAPHADPDDDAD